MSETVEHTTSTALVHVVGLHPGAGASCLAHMMGPVADELPTERGLLSEESPYVVLVVWGSCARIQQALPALQEWKNEPSVAVAGVVVVSPTPGVVPKEVQRSWEILDTAAGDIPVFRLPWMAETITHLPRQLPVWDGTVLEKKKFRKDSPWSVCCGVFSSIVSIICDTERTLES